MAGTVVRSSDVDFISVLLVEDDECSSRRTGRYLQHNACRVTFARSVSEAVSAFDNEEFDTILLDPVLPDGDGFGLCKKLRQESGSPIIIVTEMAGPWDRVRGLELGADDYVAKPFAPRELLARIHARVRRRRGQLGPAAGRLSLGDLLLVKAEQVAQVGGTTVELTAHEFHLLWTLALRSGVALRREQLVHGTELSERTVDVHISRIRSKLAAVAPPTAIPLIRTVRGVGYMVAYDLES